MFMFVFRLCRMSLHGASLDILYSFVNKKGPSLLVVRTIQNEVFGAYTSTNWQSRDGYYGTGECFVFRVLDGKVDVYNWSKKNYYMMASTESYLLIGGG